MEKNKQIYVSAVLSFVISLIILFRNNFLADTDPYLHISIVKYLSLYGFPEENPFILLTPENFNFISEKWLFYSVVSIFFRLLPFSDFVIAKIYIATVFSSIVIGLGIILRRLEIKPIYSLLIFAYPFQLFLKLRPEPLGIFLMLALIATLLKKQKDHVKISISVIILLFHSQSHAFFILDYVILLLYSVYFKEWKVLISAPLSLIFGVLLNPYGTIWISTLYLDTIPRLSFSSSLGPSELLRPEPIEFLLFAVIFGFLYKKLKPTKKVSTNFFITASFLALISSVVFLRAIPYLIIFLAILSALYIHRIKGLNYIKTLLLLFAVMNPLLTTVYPEQFSPYYDEPLQLEVLNRVGENEIVLSQWDLSPYVVYYTDSPVIVAGDAYYLWLFSPDIYRNYDSILKGNITNIDAINFTVLYFDKQRFPELHYAARKDERLSLIYENNRFVDYRYTALTF